MLILLSITKWQDSRDSGNRITLGDLPLGRLFLLNTECITDLQVHGTGSKFYYNENPLDTREGETYVETATTNATIIAGFNTALSGHFITLPIYVNNNPTRETINTTIPVALFMLASEYNPSPTDTSWVTYIKDGFKRKEVLVDLSLTEILNQVSEPLLDYDGNEYNTVVIGNQEWIVESLMTTHYANGTAIPNILDDIAWPLDVTGAYCWYNHDIANGPIYGALYSWYAVNNANILPYFTRDGVQELGWRVPSMTDWTDLVAAIGGFAIAGGLLKEPGVVYWDVPNSGATDAYGFRGRGSGNRFVDTDAGDGFTSLGTYLDAWSSDEESAPDAYSIFLSAGGTALNLWLHEKFGGMAVRCVRTI